VEIINQSVNFHCELMICSINVYIPVIRPSGPSVNSFAFVVYLTGSLSGTLQK